MNNHVPVPVLVEVRAHMARAFVLLVAISSCSKDETRVESVTPPGPPLASAERVPTAPSASAAAPAAPATSTTSTGLASALPSSSAAVPAVRVVASARPREAGAPSSVASAAASAAPPATPAPAPALPPVPFQLTSDHYSLVAAPGTNCAVDVPCDVPVRLEGRAGFHINKEYPYKLDAQSTSGVVFANASGTFSKKNGDFTEQSETAAVMRVRFTAATPGRAAIRGVYNLSVCSANKCDLEKVAIAFEAPIR